MSSIEISPIDPAAAGQTFAVDVIGLALPVGTNVTFKLSHVIGPGAHVSVAPQTAFVDGSGAVLVTFHLAIPTPGKHGLGVLGIDDSVGVVGSDATSLTVT